MRTVTPSPTARWLWAAKSGAPWVSREDPASRWQVLAMPRSSLLGALRDGQDFAFDLLESALIALDRGAFRTAVLVVGEERLGRSC